MQKKEAKEPTIISSQKMVIKLTKVLVWAPNTISPTIYAVAQRYMLIDGPLQILLYNRKYLKLCPQRLIYASVSSFPSTVAFLIQVTSNVCGGGDGRTMCSRSVHFILMSIAWKRIFRNILKVSYVRFSNFRINFFVFDFFLMEILFSVTYQCNEIFYI